MIDGYLVGVGGTLFAQYVDWMEMSVEWTVYYQMQMNCESMETKYISFTIRLIIGPISYLRRLFAPFLHLLVSLGRLCWVFRRRISEDRIPRILRGGQRRRRIDFSSVAQLSEDTGYLDLLDSPNANFIAKVKSQVAPHFRQGIWREYVVRDAEKKAAIMNAPLVFSNVDRVVSDKSIQVVD
jgi:hypothetical protein